MRFSVRVPVLSEQINVTQPIVSEATMRFTRAFCFAIRSTLTARLIATMVGKPSGTHATTSTIAAINASPTAPHESASAQNVCPRRAKKTTLAAAMPASVTHLPRRANRS